MPILGTTGSPFWVSAWSIHGVWMNGSASWHLAHWMPLPRPPWMPDHRLALCCGESVELDLVARVRDVEAVGARVERVLEEAGLPGVRVVPDHRDVVVGALFRLGLAAQQHPLGAVLVGGAGHARAVRRPADRVALAQRVDVLRVVAGCDLGARAAHLAVGAGDRGGQRRRVEAVEGGVVPLGHLLEERDVAQLLDAAVGVGLGGGDDLLLTVGLAVGAGLVERAADVELALAHDPLVVNQAHVDERLAVGDRGQHLGGRLALEPAVVVDRLEDRLIDLRAGERDARAGRVERLAVDAVDRAGVARAVELADRAHAHARVEALAVRQPAAERDEDAAAGGVVADVELGRARAPAACAQRDENDGQRGKQWGTDMWGGVRLHGGATFYSVCDPRCNQKILGGSPARLMSAAATLECRALILRG